MAKRFALPCPCGASLAVEISQAGQSLPCQVCGQPVEVPKMGDLRKMEPVADPSENAVKSSWSLEQGLLFAVGMILVLAGGIGTAFCLVNWTSIDTEPAELTTNDDWERDIDMLDAEHTWMFWVSEVKLSGLGAWEPPDYLARRKVAQFWGILTIVGAVVFVAGVVVLLMSVWKRPKPSQA